MLSPPGPAGQKGTPMKQLTFSIGPTPATLWGPESGSVFLFVHGLGGNRREAAPFAELAVPLGWQVLSVDLPEHGGRQDGAPLLPWVAVPELQAVDAYLRAHWRHVSLRATSIGAWLSLQSLGAVENCLLCSPLLDMETMITGMMAAAGVTEERLQAEGEIPTAAGPTLSWDYLLWARSHPIRAICRETDILYGSQDAMVPRATVDRFLRENPGRLTVMEGGEHWFHTPDQLAFLQSWEAQALRD